MTLTEQATALARKHQEKLRFLVVGVCNTVIGYALFAGWYFALGKFDLGALRYNLALVLAWLISVCISYTNFKLFVFKTRGTNWIAELARSYVVYFAALLVNLAILNFFVRVMHMHPLVGQLASIFIVTIMSYLGHKYFTFGAGRRIETLAEPGVFESDIEEPR